MSSKSATKTIYSLAPELIENILILASLQGDHSSIAALARTCHTFHRLICRSPDHHLWRQVFLTTFDDPRVHSRIRCLGRQTHDTFIWEAEFKNRLKAAKYIRQSLRSHGGTLNLDSDGALLSTLKAILSVISTTLPIPPHTYPVLEHSSPPLLMHSSDPKIQEMLSPCRNVTWLNRVLEDGYPPEAIQRHLQFCDLLRDGKSCDFVGLNDWETSDEGRVFNRLLYQTGFFTARSPSVLSNSNSLQTQKQCYLARRLARIKLYDMQYLSHQRFWGPFMPRDPRHPWRMVPDFAVLAAARIILEENFKEALVGEETGLDVSGVIGGFETLSTGGAPGFWNGVNSPRMENVEEEMGKAEEVMGWDWAGVTGKWMYVLYCSCHPRGALYIQLMLCRRAISCFDYRVMLGTLPFCSSGLLTNLDTKLNRRKRKCCAGY
jgi:hypothetical protein